MQSEALPCTKLPIINLGGLGVHHEEEPSQQEWDRVMHELEDAFTDLGCAYLTGHGVSEDLMNDILSSGVTFFKTEKDKTRWKIEEKGMTGHIAMASEEIFDDGKELHESFLFKEDMFDSSNEAPSFMKAVTPFFQPCQALSRRMMTALSHSLNQPGDYFGDMHKDSGTMKGNSVYRLNYYPVTKGGRENVTGIGAHFDFTLFTLLFGNDSQGLQICDSAGQWIDVPYIPGAILLLAGEFLQYYSNKRLKTGVHRVLLPDEDHPRYQPRCSMMFFVHADKGVPMWPPSDDPDSPAPPFVKEYVLGKYYAFQSTKKAKSS